MNVTEEEYILLDAARVCQQALGRICRKPDDYGCVIFVENRYRNILSLLGN